MGDALFTLGGTMPPAYPERAAWGTAPKLRHGRPRRCELVLRAGRPRTSSRWRPRAPARRPSRCAWPPMLVDAGTVNRITVVAPTDHLKTPVGGRRRARRDLPRPELPELPTAVMAPALPRRRGHLRAGGRPSRCCTGPTPRPRRTLVILDEIHHGGDALSWGDGIREAFEPATRRLALTGTPFRSDTAPIPFVDYAEDEDGIRRSQADYTYGYGSALADGVVRPVMFMAYSGDDALAHQRGRRDGGPARRGRHQGHHRPGLAHRAGPAGRVDPVRARAPRTGG